jgi:alanine dehydrogenase
MRVGVPREVKDNEFRVGLVPETVAQLVRRGHTVLVETQAGAGAGLSDHDYASAGAEVVQEPSGIFATAELIVKVKEPLAAERKRLRRGQMIFTYLHLAPDPEQARDLLASGVSAIAYETVTDASGHLPLLHPMSEVAGRLAPQIGAHYLERPQGGRGILLGGAAGAAPANVAVIGAGSVGGNAAMIALAMGAHVTVLARTAQSLQHASDLCGPKLQTAISAPQSIDAACRAADLVICAALVPGAAAAKLVTAATVKRMKQGSVLVDVSIDQGGNAETSHPTTHSQPVFVVDGVIHYCVTNMPGAVARTSTFALNAATRPFVRALADKGLARALAEDTHLRDGLNIHEGRVTCRAVADALGLPYGAPQSVAG